MIFLLTPTGARPKQLQLCEFFMSRQTYGGQVCWIIIDDALPKTADKIHKSVHKNWSVIHAYPRPVWKVGQNTQGRNLAAGLKIMLENYNRQSIDAIYIIEDDDYYKPHYLEEMQKRLGGYLLAGEMHTIYYNVRLWRWHENENEEWSSLFQTAFRYEIIPKFKALLTEKFIDYQLFRYIAKGKNLFRAGDLAIGIKGQAGRGGIGAGHGTNICMKLDAEQIKLKELLGCDAKLYINE